uniref:ATP synthase subunit a n=1 Tax=Pachycephus smyrnensis TaxID=1090887 RepID=A0A1W6Q5D9_9HYME|nr:ATP synthase F0 subunit 6 [Pachycephus smyrnensis]ARO34949.1 ATP synthase F0 subunit 6 [Pachycephus smyrnensis]UTY22576.1 ATP synthase F0 subunit 6 [Pachycephus smyrnensis]
MMTNLFSIFDPTSSMMMLSINWVSSMLIFMILPYSFWLIPSRYYMLWIMLINFINKELKILINKNASGSNIIFISIFLFIMINNFMGLFPYIFTSSSHIIMTLSLSLPLWISLMIFGWMNFYTHMFAHMVPLGTPPILMPFMVIIETISNLIRPGTLAVRLAANMIAGHLLLTLISSTGPSMNIILIIMMILAQILLLLLETAVAIIQAYVFSILSTLYLNEIK